MTRVTFSRRVWRNVFLSSLVLLAAACGSGGSSPGSPASAGSPPPGTAAPSASSPASTSALCEEVDALRGSLQKLTSIRPSLGTVNELRTALQDVQSKLSSLGGAASTQWSAQIGNLNSALTKLQSAVSTLAAERNASSVSGVITATGSVAVAARQFLAAASSSCPSPSASPASGT